MRLFIAFVRNCYAVSRHVRGVIYLLLLQILLGAVVIAKAEGIGLGTSLYFAFVTGTTIGYGDVTPATTLGRVVSIWIGITGLVFFGIAVAICNRALQISVQAEKDQQSQ